MPLSWASTADAESFASHFHFPFVVLHLTLGQGKYAMGDAENSGESVHSDRDGVQQGTPEQRIKLVKPRVPLP